MSDTETKDTGSKQRDEGIEDGYYYAVGKGRSGRFGYDRVNGEWFQRDSELGTSCPTFNRDHQVLAGELVIVTFDPEPCCTMPARPAKDDKHSAVMKDRQKVYGDPKENHIGIAQAWAGLLQPWAKHIEAGIPIPPHVVALMMAALKINRMRRVYKDDNYLDAQVYMKFAEEWQRDDCPGGPESVELPGLVFGNLTLSQEQVDNIKKHMADMEATVKWRRGQGA